MRIKNHLHKKGFALGLVLKQCLAASRKWPIADILINAMQIIWNNRYIKINKKSVFFKDWYQSGVKNVSSLIHEQEKCFLSFQSFQTKIHLDCNFLQYYGLLSAIPSPWKELLKLHTEELPCSTLNIEGLTCKTIYNLLINRINLPPPTADKKTRQVWFWSIATPQSKNIGPNFRGSKTTGLRLRHSARALACVTGVLLGSASWRYKLAIVCRAVVIRFR